LNIALRTDPDIIRISVHDALKPDIRFRTDLDISNDGGIVGDESSPVNFRDFATERDNHVCAPIPSHIFEK